MTRIYFIILIGALVTGAYFYGVNIGRTKCETKYLQNNLQETQQTQQNKKVIHDTVYKTGVADIRRILFDRYTIAE